MKPATGDYWKRSGCCYTLAQTLQDEEGRAGLSQALRRPLATSLVSLTLSAGVIGAWLALHIFAVWHLDAVADPLLAVLCLVGLT